MDISIRDKLLDDLQIELQHKKRFLKNKYIDIKKTSDDNIFLEGVKNDYKQHYEYIKKIKQEQYRSMAIIVDYLDNLLAQGKGAEKTLKSTRKQQKGLLEEMDKIQTEIDELVELNNEV